MGWCFWLVVGLRVGVCWLAGFRGLAVGALWCGCWLWFGLLGFGVGLLRVGGLVGCGCAVFLDGLLFVVIAADLVLGVIVWFLVVYLVVVVL